MSYLKPDFLLENKTAKIIYSEIKDLPIFDYHCHLNEKEILENKPFTNIFELTLKYDHYKWRLMRNAGIEESYITGNKTEEEKFIKYCEALQDAFGNPLYHWSQIELEEYFDCKLEINKDNAKKIWDYCNEFLKKHKLTPIDIIQKSNVKYICTTNKIFDDLTTFEKINEKELGFKVFPSFRGDDLLNIETECFNELVDKSGIKNLKDFEVYVEEKLKEFIAHGCFIADIGFEKVYINKEKYIAENVFNKKINNEHLEENDIHAYKGYFLYYLLSLFSKYNIACELHIGPKRNVNTSMHRKLGPDSGFDIIGDDTNIDSLKALFDDLSINNSLGKVILFNLNDNNNKTYLSLIGAFQNAGNNTLIQYGPAWWFLDNKKGIYNHLDDLANMGHLGSFIGMLTDSRSFLSYQRHQYFRRLLSNYLGNLYEMGEITDNLKLIIEVAKNISFDNALRYFSLK